MWLNPRRINALDSGIPIADELGQTLSDG